MPKCIAYYGKGRKSESKYDTLYDAMNKGEIEIKYNGAIRVEVYDKHGDIVARKSKIIEEE